MPWLCGIILLLHGLYFALPTLHQRLNPVLAALLLGLLLSACRSSLATRSWRLPTTTGLQQQALRLGIVLFALQIDPYLVLATDPWLFARLLLLIALIFSLAYGLGVYVFRLRPPQVLLLSAGFSFCGTSAIAATQLVQQGASATTGPSARGATAAEFSQSLALVMLLGLCALLVYSLLAQAEAVSVPQLAWLIGSTAPEVSQAVAGASQLGAVAALAVMIKLARVCLLVPFLLVLNQRQPSAHRAPLPWFIFGFVALLLGQLYWPLRPEVRAVAAWLSQSCLMLAMLLIGSQTCWQDLRQCQGRTVAFALTVMLCLFGLAWLLM